MVKQKPFQLSRISVIESSVRESKIPKLHTDNMASAVIAWDLIRLTDQISKIAEFLQLEEETLGWSIYTHKI